MNEKAHVISVRYSWYLCVVLCWGLWVGCGTSEDDPPKQVVATLGDWFDEPLQDFPDDLSGFGLYSSMDTLDVPGSRVITYSPRYPLWSNSSIKTRHIVLPEGMSIDNSEEHWTFPVGSVVFKTFSYPKNTDDEALRHIETRVLRRTEDGWEYGSYLWDEQGEDAVKLDMKRSVAVPVELGTGASFDHKVPNKLECRSCHEASPEIPLGLRTAQLSEEHMEMDGEIPLQNPLPTSLTTLDDDPETAWVKGYMLGNCVHCHNGSEQNSNSTYDLSPDVFLSQTIERETEGNASAIGVRIVPGDPEASVLYRAMRGAQEELEIKEMPPVGVQHRDESSIERLGDWIKNLSN